MTVPLLEAREIKKYFPVTGGFLMRLQEWVKAVDGVSFTLDKGETLGLVGESGCGKTTTSKLILLLEKLTAGDLLFHGHPLQEMSREDLRKYRRSVQAVFQDPWSSLDPRMNVGQIIREPLVDTHALPRKLFKDRISELMSQVGLPANSPDLYPHEFSGGQRQRIAIARALSTKPDLIVLDEPVSALDVSIRAQLMNLLKNLQEQLGLTYLLIAHHLAVVKHMSTRIAVMYLGRIVENAASTDIHAHPLHPYTIALMSAALPMHPDIQRKEVILPGEVPSPINPPSGCHFHPRCSYAEPICHDTQPALVEAASGHWVACHLHARISIQDRQLERAPAQAAS